MEDSSEWLSEANPILEYYDSDFPSRLLSRYPENLDKTVEFQGLSNDVGRYLQIAAEERGPILELCSGTGRVAIPLLLAGHEVTAVDFSPGLLQTLDDNVGRVAPEVRDRLDVVRQDVTELEVGEARFGLAIMAFNSLLCIPSFDAQRRLLVRAARALRPGGLLVLDVLNPLVLEMQGRSAALPFFTRRHPVTGRRYTRFAMVSAFDADQVQELYGWYDELDEEERVCRRFYATKWRLIHRFELALMLEVAQFSIETLEGGHDRQPYVPTSSHLFVRARRR